MPTLKKGNVERGKFQGWKSGKIKGYFSLVIKEDKDFRPWKVKIFSLIKEFDVMGEIWKVENFFLEEGNSKRYKFFYLEGVSQN